MNTHLVALLVLTGSAALAAGACGSPEAPAAHEETASQGEAMSSLVVDRYFTVRRDMREARPPERHGYLVQEVNGEAPARYVAALDLSQAGLDPGATRAVEEAPNGDLVLYGSFVPSVTDHDFEDLAVKAAYRGLPGMAPAPGDGFYVARDHDPLMVCFAAPCDDEVASLLDTAETHDFTTLSVARAAAPHVDQAWLANRVRRHGAVVAAHFRDGYVTRSGTEKVLDVSQVFLRLPDHGGPCLLVYRACFAPRVATYTRDVNRCVTFSKCVEPRECSHLRLPPCEDGYDRVSWSADNATCEDFACDPAFLAE